MRKLKFQSSSKRDAENREVDQKFFDNDIAHISLSAHTDQHFTSTSGSEATSAASAHGAPIRNESD